MTLTRILMLKMRKKIIALLTSIWEEPSRELLQRIISIIQSRIFAGFCVLLSIGCLALMCYHCMSPAIQYDSSASIFIIQTGYEELIKITAADVHPPLYYIILKAGSDLILSFCPALTIVQACKIMSLIPFVLAVCLCLTVVRKTWGWYVAGLGALSIITAPLALEIGMEIRMYSWAMFFVLACYIFSFKALQTNKWGYWLLFALSGVASAYTHTYACVAVMPIYLFCGWCSIRSRNRKSLYWWVGSCLFAIVSYLPWLGILLRQTAYVTHGFWIPQPTIREVVEYYLLLPYGFRQILSPNFSLIVYACGLLCILSGYLYRRSNTTPVSLAHSLCGLSIYPFLLIVGLVITFTTSPAFHSRSLVPGIACTWLGLLLYSKITARNLIQPLLACLIFISALVQVKAYHCSQSEWATGANELIRYADQSRAEVIVTPTKSLAVPLAFVLNRPVYVYKGTGDFQAAWYDMACHAHARIHHLSTEEDLMSLIKRHQSVLYVDCKENGEDLSQLSAIRHQPLLPMGAKLSMYRDFYLYSLQADQER